MSISPTERLKINSLIFKLGLEKVPADTNIMAWALPVLEAIVKRVEIQDQRVLQLENQLKALERDPQR